jgi:hypothetical protein
LNFFIALARGSLFALLIAACGAFSRILVRSKPKPLRVTRLLQHARALADGQSDAWAMFDGAGEEVFGLGEIVASVEQALDPPCRRGSIARPCRTCRTKS